MQRVQGSDWRKPLALMEIKTASESEPLCLSSSSRQEPWKVCRSLLQHLAIEMRLKTDFLLGIIVQPTSSRKPSDRANDIQGLEKEQGEGQSDS